MAWLHFLRQLLEYYLERCYDYILPRNFNECRGGMISLVLQTGCPNISVMLLLVLLSCCQDCSNLTHMPPKTVSVHILSNSSCPLILCFNRGHVGLWRYKMYCNVKMWYVRLMFVPPRIFQQPDTIALEVSDFVAI